MSYPMLPRPLFVSSHAVEQYLSRIEPGAMAAEAIYRIQEALQHPAFTKPGRDGALLVGAVTETGLRFVAVVYPSTQPSEWPQIVSLGGWYCFHHEVSGDDWRAAARNGCRWWRDGGKSERVARC